MKMFSIFQSFPDQQQRGAYTSVVVNILDMFFCNHHSVEEGT